MPMCQAMLQNQAKNMTCQKVNFTWPGWGAPPFQMTVLARCQKSPHRPEPHLPQADDAEGSKTSTIHGAAILAKRETNL